MTILRQLVFLLLLSGVWCQNNRNAKAGGKSSKKSSRNQGGDVSQSTTVVDVTAGSIAVIGVSEGTGDTGGTSVTGGTGATRGTGGTGSSRGTGVLGSSRGTLVTGSARGAEVTGSARGSGGAGATGNARGTEVTGSARGSGGTGGTGSTRGTEVTGSARGSGGTGGTGSTRSTEVTGSARGTGGSGSTRGTEATGSARGSGGTGSTGSTRNTEVTGSARGSGGTGSTGSTRNTEVTGSTRGSGGTGSTRNTEVTGSARASGSTGSTRNTEVTGSARASGSTGGTGSTRASGGTGGSGGTGSTRGTGEVAESGREGTAGANGQEMDINRLQFLKNTQVTCNDGTAAGFYLKESKGSRRWLLYLEGGHMCYDRETCDSRYQTSPTLMSSSRWPQTRTAGGILSSQAEENPYWHNANIVIIPYCSSDLWTGTRPAPSPPIRPRQGREKDRERNANTTEFSFMGSLIIREVIKDLILKGIKLARVVMLSGSSAGGLGVLLNVDSVTSQLEQLGSKAQVRGLVDSAWFLENDNPPICPENVSCSTESSISKGLRLWNGALHEKFLQFYKGEPKQCSLVCKLYPTISSPLFVMQWLFDTEQLGFEKISLGAQNLSQEQWLYFQTLGIKVSHYLRDVTSVFAASCFGHSMLYDSKWQTFQIRGTSLPRALYCWERSLEATRTSKTPAKGCPFHLIDTCQWPQCNPTCPPLVDPATQQEVTLLQMLESMGLDVQNLDLVRQEDGDSPVSLVSNGG